jgi:hypothetical protein
MKELKCPCTKTQVAIAKPISNVHTKKSRPFGIENKQYPDWLDAKNIWNAALC